MKTMTAAEYLASQGKKIRSKYGAVKVRDEGVTFDSKAEHRRFCELRVMEKAGLISKLEAHPKFELHANGKHIGFYTADSGYVDQSGSYVVEDVKSPATRKSRDYRLRRQLMRACYGIEIKEYLA